MRNTVLFEKYRIIKLLGTGGMSRVYLAENIKLGNRWAIKRISKDKNIINLLAEPNILKDLKHEAIPQIIDIEEDEHYFYIIEEYVDGITLKDYKLAKVINENMIINLASQLCDVLEYLHSRKPYPIIYRDMKPDNIMLMENDKIKLIDFGIAREYKYYANTDTVAIGTRGYAAPEQYGISQSDERTDIYGLGVTLYFLLTGKNPGNPPTKIILPKQLYSNISEELYNIILICTELLPSNRFQSVTDLKERINNLLPEKNLQFKEVITSLKHQSVGIIALTKRAGSTFVATNLARAIADCNVLVSLVELPYGKPYIYDLVGIGNHMEKKGITYHSILHDIANGKPLVRCKDNSIENIMYFVPDPTLKPIDNWSNLQTRQAISIARSGLITIVDIGEYSEKMEELLHEFDLLMVVFDGFPPDIIGEYGSFKLFKKLEEMGHNIHYILNYDNKGINKKSLLKYLNIKHYNSLPDIPREFVYNSAYKKKIAYTNKHVKELLEVPLGRIIDIIIPSIRKKSRKRKKQFKG